MTEIFPKDVYSALKTVLSNSSYLTYFDEIVIRKFRRGNLPDFEYYCIVISPQSALAVVYPAHQRYIENTIQLVMIGKMLGTEEEAILADSPLATPPKVGILAMYEDIVRTLYENDLGGAIEFTPGLKELDYASDFDVVVEEEREGFLMEMRMSYHPKGARFVDLK